MSENLEPRVNGAAEAVDIKPLPQLTLDSQTEDMRKVEAVIQSAVSAESARSGTARRAISTCRRPAKGPCNGDSQRRPPPVRRATRTMPEIARSAMLTAPVAMTSRPPSPRNSERCRLVNHRCV